MVLVIFWKKMTNPWKGFSKRFIFILCFCINFLFLVPLLLDPVSNRLIMSPREYIVMANYLSTSIAINKLFGKKETKKWLCEILKNDNLKLMLVKEDGETLSCQKPSSVMLSIRDDVIKNKIKLSILKKRGHLIVNNDSTNHPNNYWLISAASKITWGDSYRYTIAYRIIASLVLSIVAFVVSLLFISLPISKLRNSLTQVSKGKFDERMPEGAKIYLQEFRDLNKDFNTMGKSIEKFISLKDDVLEIISHELKSPLARQQAAINILKTKTEKEDLKYLLQIGLDNKAITNIINDTLDYIKLHRENRAPNKSAFDLIATLNQIIENVAFEFSDIHYQLSTPKQCFFKGDKSLINIVLENIITNAAKHASNNKEITITLTETSTKISLSVKDRGPGVKNNNLEKIFEPYFSEGKTSTNRKNHGLGLAITKKIITLHNGTIEAKNRRNGGLSICITFPTH